MRERLKPMPDCPTTISQLVDGVRHEYLLPEPPTMLDTMKSVPHSVAEFAKSRLIKVIRLMGSFQ